MTKKRVYLITGFMCDEHIWDLVISNFDSSYEFIHVPIPLENSMDKLIKNLQIKDDNIYLIGFSLGAYIASLYALQNQSKINKLLLISSSLCALSLQEVIQRKKAIEYNKKFGFKTLSSKKIKSLLDEENQNNNDLIKLIQNMYKNMGEECFYTQSNATLNRIDLEKELIKSSLNLSFFYSNKDKMINQKWLEKLQKNQKFSFEILDSSSHMLPLEKSTQLSNYIKDYIKSIN